MVHDLLSNWSIYFHAAPWRCVFGFLSSLSASSEECARISLQGDDIYAVIMSYHTRRPGDAHLETHDQYIDIQMSLSGSERIDWFPRQGLQVREVYDPHQDRTFYQRPGISPARVNNFPGFLTVLFPDDAHMPMLMTADNSELVKKVVVKVRGELVL